MLNGVSYGINRQNQVSFRQNCTLSNSRKIADSNYDEVNFTANVADIKNVISKHGTYSTLKANLPAALIGYGIGFALLLLYSIRYGTPNLIMDIITTKACSVITIPICHCCSKKYPKVLNMVKNRLKVHFANK
jgi:hypothetical protein